MFTHPFEHFNQMQPKISHLSAYPASYQTYLKKVKPTFLKKYRFPTIEPTRDGLDYLECHYFMTEATPLSEEIQLKSQLPADFLPFSVVDSAYLAFDLRQNQDEPPIIFIDLEMDQWLSLAESFPAFLEQLVAAPLSLPIQADENWRLDFPELKLWHYLGIATASEATILLQLLESNFPKDDYLNWLTFYLKKSDAYAEIVLKALNIQILYFQPQLDIADSQHLIQALATLPQLKTQLTLFQKNW